MPKKLTKAEKLELKKREEEELALKLKKEKLDRELEFTHSQVSELRRKVFEQASIINLPIIKEEWLHKWGYFERTIDWKDFYISQLRDDIFYYELHHRHMEQRHNENIHKLLDIFNEGIEKVMETYQTEREKLLKNRKYQETRLVVTHERRSENMQCIIKTLMDQRKEEMEKLNWENANQRQLKIFRYEAAIERIAQEGDEEIRELWTNMKSIFDKYKSTTSKKRQSYLIMKQKDLAEKNNLDQLSKRMTQLHRTIKQCRGKLNKLKLDEGMKRELEIRRDSHEHLKQDMRNWSDHSNRQLENLAVTSSSVIEKLNKFGTKLMDGITLICICKKLETQEEKVAPRNIINPPLHLFKYSQVLPLFDDLEILWAKTLSVSKMKEHMQGVLSKLMEENSALSEKLKKALTTYKVSCPNLD